MASQRESAEKLAKEYLGFGYPERGAARVSYQYLVYRLAAESPPRTVALAHRSEGGVTVLHKDERFFLPSPAANLVNVLERVARESGVAVSHEHGLTEAYRLVAGGR